MSGRTRRAYYIHPGCQRWAIKYSTGKYKCPDCGARGMTKADVRLVRRPPGQTHGAPPMPGVV